MGMSAAILVSLSALLTLGAGLKVLSRQDWGARDAVRKEALDVPVPLTFIHHTHTMNCSTPTSCCNLVRAIQHFHMDANGWWDIGYSFLVGGGGLVLEGRGWQVVGAHVLHYNTQSLGIAVLGNYAQEQPNTADLTAVQELINMGVKKGYIKGDYLLFGHRQAQNDTSCPGDRLYSLIQAWPHYSTKVPPHQAKPYTHNASHNHTKAKASTLLYADNYN